MQVPSKLQSPADVCSSPVSVREIKEDLRRASLEEFPEGPQFEYDWILQPASQFKPEPVIRILAVVATVLFVAFTMFLLNKL